MTAEDSKSKRAAHGAGQMLVDLGPVIVFVLSYNILQRSMGEDAIFWATGLFMAATALAIAYSWLRTRHIPPVLIVTGVLVVFFGGLTIALRDQTFIMIKPIFVYLLYAGAILGAQLFGVNLWKVLFRHAFTLPDRIWSALSWRWGLFFVFMALVSLVLWLSVEEWKIMTQEAWVGSRLWLIYPLIIGFALLNVPMMMKYIGKEEEVEEAQEPGAAH